MDQWTEWVDQRVGIASGRKFREDIGHGRYMGRIVRTTFASAKDTSFFVEENILAGDAWP
jgi:hypothetical protein